MESKSEWIAGGLHGVGHTIGTGGHLVDLRRRNSLILMIFLFSLFSFLIVGLFPALLYRTINSASYLVFHNIVELFSVIVSLSIAIIGWNTCDKSKHWQALLISCSFLSIGLIDFMRIFPACRIS